MSTLRASWYPGVPASQANFLWLPLGDRRPRPSPPRAPTPGVLVRPFAGDGVRVTIGAPEENDAFLAVAERVLRRG